MADGCDPLVRIIQAMQRQYRRAGNHVPDRIIREVYDTFSELPEAQRFERAKLILDRMNNLTDDAQDALEAFYRVVEGGNLPATRILDALLETLQPRYASEFITAATECAEAFTNVAPAMAGLRRILRSAHDMNGVRGTYFHLRFLQDVGPRRFGVLEGGGGIRGLDAELLASSPPYRGGRFFELKSGTSGVDSTSQVAAQFARAGDHPEHLRFVVNASVIGEEGLATSVRHIWEGIVTIPDAARRRAAYRHLFGSDYDSAFDYDVIAIGDIHFPEIARALPDRIRANFMIEHPVPMQ